MRLRSVIIALMSVIFLIGALHSQTEEDIKKARRLRANAAYLEMKGEKEKALAEYQESLQYVKDEVIATKVTELQRQIASPVQQMAPQMDHVQHALEPGVVGFDELAAGASFSKLDLNPYLLAYVSVETIILPLRDELLKIAIMVRDASEQDTEEYGNMDMLLGKVDPFLEWLGVYGIKSFAVSLAPNGPKQSRVKSYTMIAPDARERALWQLLGEPTPLEGRGYLPDDTVIGVASTLSLGKLWDVIIEGMVTFAPEEANQQREMQLAMLKENMGIDVEAMIDSVADEILFAVTMSKTQNVSVPGPEGNMLEIPAPGILIGLRVENPTIMETIQTMIQGQQMPVAKQMIDGIEAISMGLPIPIPITLEPTLMMHNDMLLLASSPALMEKAVASLGSGSGLVATSEYKAKLGDMPGRVNTLTYIDQRFYAELIEFTTMAMRQEMMSSMDDEDLVPLTEYVISLMEETASNSASSYEIMDAEGIYSVTNMTTSDDNVLVSVIKQPMAAAILAGLEEAAYSRQYEEASECYSNLGLIDYAKYEWANEQGLTEGTPTQEDLMPYLDGEFPQCPYGGNYSINGINESATCDLHPY